ncbi:MAG: Piwi domain-containing protein, partial [bacterium]|nr:Piwi domain-containing protein [bacterium]
ISIFYDEHLKGKHIGDIIHVLEAGMAEVLESRVRRAPVETNVLEFKGSNTHFNAYIGLKENGPLASPNIDSYKFFFIFHEDSREQANKLYQYLNRGFKGYPGLKSFVDVNLSLDTDKTIKFSNFDRPSDEIIDGVRKKNFSENESYFAIYLSPISRDEMDEEKKADYYRVKNELLSKNIASQVIFRENIENPNFNFFLPNISIAILAKLGGRPWRLSRQVKDELIIGVGAYRQDNSKYLGTTFSFRNDGTFLGFDATECPDVQELGVFFKQTISSFVSEMSELKRVVVHFFKKMNSDEERQLTGVFSDLGLRVPYFVLNVTEGNGHEYLVIDDKYAGKMPRSGICVKLKTGEFLLCNNTRYKEHTGARIDEFPFPLKISVSKPSPRTITDEVIHDLIDQIYQFSRMYWRSVKQRAMPVTILYSEMIAKMAANLPDKAIPDTSIAKRTLWFL